MRTEAPFKAVAIVGFKDGQGGVEQFAFGDDDNVEAWRDLVATENLSYQSFSSISLNGAAELFRRRDAQPTDRVRVPKDEQGSVAPVDPGATFVHLPKLHATPDTFIGPELSGPLRQFIRC